MTALFLAAATVQAILMVFDEFFFHWKRILPRWERIGHPVDSISLLLPIGIAAFGAKTSASEIAFTVLAVLSCICITKDEWVHQAHSSAGENWVHSALFILHPVILIASYMIWEQGSFLLQMFFASIFVFMLYQTFFWNFYADRILQKR